MKTIKIQFEDLPNTNATSPAFSYCRKLIKEGVDPDTRLEIYRGKPDWDYAIANIGQGAKLTIQEEPRLRIIKYRDPALRLEVGDKERGNG